MQETEEGDGALVRRVRQGDVLAFEALVHRHARAALAVAVSVLGNRADAEDVCQDAWVRALEKLDRCREPDRFVGWLLRIVRNRALNYLEYRKLRMVEPLENAMDAPLAVSPLDPARDRETNLLRARIEEAIARLAVSHREVLLLHDFAGWTHQRIAEDLEISEVLCRQRLFQARTRLRNLLGDGVHGAEP